MNSKLMAAAALLLAGTAQAMVIVDREDLQLDLYGRGQMIGVGQHLRDPIRDDNRIYLFMKQARVGIRGRKDDVKFDTQYAFGGENANGSNTDLGLLDFVADIPVKPVEGAVFKIGQFRVPYSREGLTDRGYLNFGDRSVANLGTYHSRDYGLALMAARGPWTGTVGTFSSGGRDVPQRYLPEDFGVPYLVARLGYNDGVDEDIYHVKQTDIGLARTTKALFVNGIYVKDTKIGHSTAIQSRTIDKNLLVDTGFNPFINQGGGSGLGTIAGTRTMSPGEVYWYGGDAVLRHPLGTGRALELEVEGNYGAYKNKYGRIDLSSYRVQADYRRMPFEAGLRYAVLDMSSKSGFLSSSLTGTGTTPGAVVRQYVKNGLGKPVQEITPSLTWHFKGHDLKLVADLPVYLDCPVWYDLMGNAAPAGSQPVGAYAFPDPTSTTQNSLLATPGNRTARKTVIEARMMFQVQF